MCIDTVGWLRTLPLCRHYAPNLQQARLLYVRFEGREVVILWV